MSEQWINALLAFAWTTISTLAALKIVPSQTGAMGWIDALYPAAISGILAGLGTFTIQTSQAKQFLGRKGQP